MNEEYKSLIGLRDSLLAKLEKNNPKVIRRLITVLDWIEESRLNNTVVVEKKESSNNVDLFAIQPGKQLKPVEAAEKLFRNNPDDELTPPQLRNYLKQLKEHGELNHKGKNMLTTAHTVLKVLVKKGFVEKIQRENEDPVYTLKK